MTQLNQSIILLTEHRLLDQLLDQWPFLSYSKHYGAAATLALLSYFTPLHLHPLVYVDVRVNEQFLVLVTGDLLFLAQPGERIDYNLIIDEATASQLSSRGLKAKRAAARFDMMGSLVEDYTESEALTISHCVMLAISWERYYEELSFIVYAKNLPFLLRSIRLSHQLFGCMSIRSMRGIFQNVVPRKAVQYEIVVEENNIGSLLIVLLRGQLQVAKKGIALLTILEGQLYGLQQLMLQKPHQHELVCQSQKAFYLALPGTSLRELIVMTNDPLTIRRYLEPRLLHHNSLYRQKLNSSRELAKRTRPSPARPSTRYNSSCRDIHEMFQFFKEAHREKIKHQAKLRAGDRSRSRTAKSLNLIRPEPVQIQDFRLSKLKRRVYQGQEYSTIRKLQGFRDSSRAVKPSPAVKHYKQMLHQSRIRS